MSRTRLIYKNGQKEYQKLSKAMRIIICSLLSIIIGSVIINKVNPWLTDRAMKVHYEEVSQMTIDESRQSRYQQSLLVGALQAIILVLGVRLPWSVWKNAVLVLDESQSHNSKKAGNTPNQDEIFLDDEPLEKVPARKMAKEIFIDGDSEDEDYPESKLGESLNTEGKEARATMLRVTRNKLRMAALNCRLELEKPSRIRDRQIYLDSIAALSSALEIFRLSGFNLSLEKSKDEDPYRNVVDRCENLLELTKVDVNSHVIMTDDATFRVQIPID